MGHNSDTWDDKLGITDTLERDIYLEKHAKSFREETLTEATLDTEQVRALARQDLDFFASLAIPDIYEFPFPPVHKAAWQLVLQSEQDLSNVFLQLALGIPRGFGKTTFIKLVTLYFILYTNRRFPLVLGPTASHSENILSDVCDMLDEPNIKAVFGDWRLSLEMDRQDQKRFSFRGRPIILAALGAGGSLRGLNIKNSRPDVMIFDDIQTKEDSESKLVSEALERWMIGTAMKAKAPSGCLFVFAGNMYPGPNSILKKLKSNPTWIKFISGAILSDGSSLWPELRSRESLIQELDNDISMGHPEIFFSEVMNDTEAGINTRTDLSKIKEWPWAVDEIPQGKFIVIDPSANKRGGDKVCIGMFEVYDELLGFRTLIEENLSPGNTVRAALLLALNNNVRLIAVESVGYQATLLYWFNIIAEQLGLTGFRFVEVHSGSYSKNARITDMLKALTAGEIVPHPSTVSQISNQISNWNPMKRDNDDGILDVLTYGPKVLKMYGSACMTVEEELILDGESPGVLEVYETSNF